MLRWGDTRSGFDGRPQTSTRPHVVTPGVLDGVTALLTPPSPGVFPPTESGKIHKVLERKSGGFIIAEYSPFKDRTHILDMMLQGDEVRNTLEINLKGDQVKERRERAEREQRESRERAEGEQRRNRPPSST